MRIDYITALKLLTNMKPLFFFILMSLCLFVSAQNDKPLNENFFSEKVVNQILFEIISSDSTILDKNYKIVDGFNSDLQAPARQFIDSSHLIKPYFDSSDRAFCLEQVQKNRSFKIINKALANSYQFISIETIKQFIKVTEDDYVAGKPSDFDVRFENQLGKIQEFCLPFISRNGKYVFIRYIKYTTSKNYQGWMKIFAKNGDKWIAIRTIKQFSK